MSPLKNQAESIRRASRKGLASRDRLDQEVNIRSQSGKVVSPEDDFAAVIMESQKRDLTACPKDCCDGREEARQAYRRLLQLAIQSKAEVREPKQWNLIILQGEQESSKPFEVATLQAHRELEKAGHELKVVALRYGVDLEYEFGRAEREARGGV